MIRIALLCALLLTAPLLGACSTETVESKAKDAKIAELEEMRSYYPALMGETEWTDKELSEALLEAITFMANLHERLDELEAVVAHIVLILKERGINLLE